MKNHYKLSFGVSLLLMLLSYLGFSQNLGIQWSAFSGNVRMDMASQVEPTADGGYVVFGEGWAAVTPPGLVDGRVMKLDNNGNILWDRFYGGNHNDALFAGQQTADGGYIAAGYAASSDGIIGGPPGGLSHAWLLKLNASGDVVWSKLYPGTGQEIFYALRQTSDGGYILGGRANNFEFPESGGLVMKVDAAGNEQWTKHYGGLVTGYGPGLYIDDIKPLAGGGYILAGISAYEPGGDIGEHIGAIDAWLARIDGQGELIWETVYGGTRYDYFTEVVLTPDGGYMMAGYTSSDDVDIAVPNQTWAYWVAKVDGQGQLLWNRVFNDQPGFCFSIANAANGGYITAGYKGEDMYVLKLDAAGNEAWHMALDGYGAGDQAKCIRQTPDGGYIVAGYSDNRAIPTEPDHQIAVFKLRNPDLPFNVDLSLTMSMSNPAPPAYSNTAVKVKVTNSGTDAATGVKLRFPKPVGTVYVGGNEWTATQGSFITYGAEEWNVGTINAGKSAELTVNYFMLTANPVKAYAQVWAMNQPDMDSSPGNGTPPTPQEDDEAVAVINGSSVCGLVAIVGNQVCTNNGTPNNPNDDVYELNFSATNTSASTGFQFHIVQTGATYNGVYNAGMGIPNMLISLGTLTVEITDNLDPNCTATLQVVPPAPCSGSAFCQLNFDIAVNHCDDNNTPGNTSDDFFTSYLAVGGSNTGNAGWTATVAGATVTGNYGQWKQLGPFPMSGGNIPITVWDTQYPSCTKTGTIVAPHACHILPDLRLSSFLAVGPVNGGSNNMINPNDQILAGASFGIPDHGAYFDFQNTVPAFTVAINTYFSSDATWSNNDLLLGTHSFTIYPNNQMGGFSEGGLAGGTIPASTPSGTYYIIVKYDATDVLAEYDEVNNIKSLPITVLGAAGTIDLELSMLQNSANPVIYSHYTTTLTLRNQGSLAATGVKVKWMKPTGVVYTGGNEFVASQGSFNPNGDQVWTVGSVPANGTATLRVSYFLLQNGAPITYAQVSAANETDPDSQPNNGTPPTPNQDDEAASGGSAPPVLTPDLTISNLTISNSPIQSGQVLTYNFDLANIGNGNASGDFVVRAYISIYPSFNTNGIQDGIVPTGNFIAGFSVTGVPGASRIPFNLADGAYYLYLFVDADQSVNESNEWNNQIGAAFIIHGLPQPGPCDEEVKPGTIHCISNNGAGQLEITYQPNPDLRKAVLDETGQVISDQLLGPAPLVIDFQVNAGKLEKYIGQNLIYSKTIPTAILSEYDRIVGFTEFNSGFIIFGHKISNFNSYAIRTNADIVVQQTAYLSNSLYNTHSISNAGQISPNEIRFVLNTQPGHQSLTSEVLVVMRGDLTIASTEILANTIIARVDIVPNLCGNYNISIFRQEGPCRIGSCYEQEYRQGRFVNGHFVTDASYLLHELSWMGNGTRERKWTLRSNDGGLITATNTEQFHFSTPYNNNVVHLKKTLGNATLWEKDVTVASASAVRWLAMSGNELIVLSEKVNAIFAETLTCMEGSNPPPPVGCGAVTITPAPGQITIAGFSAPHVLIKVFRPNWTVAFECLDNCANPLVVSGLSAGTYHLQVKLIDNGWGTICYLERDVNLSSFGGGNGSDIAKQDDRLRLSFEKFYPNPSAYQVFVDLYSPKAQHATLDFYDQQGRFVHSMEAELEEGVNTLEVMVYDWKSGTYNVVARGEETALPAYGRLMKVWEE